MLFIIKLLWSKFSRFIGSIYSKAIKTKFFLFVLALTLGISYTTVYFVGQPMYADLFFTENKLVYVNTHFIQSAYAKKLPETVEATEPEIEWMKGEFTAYTPRVEETDGDPYTNAANKRVKDGDIACPVKYAFGTKIEVKGRGIYQCWDRMNQRYQEKENFDIFMWDLASAKSFGRQQLEYRIIEK